MSKIFLKIIRFYQILISPMLGNNCRFEPSCSNYCYLAIEKYGARKGVRLGLKRILRCNPWSRGGIDEL
ncbi:MAG: membrane protein insertion efficiency factor YidD [bacterium]|nr:membrane protein insertion efficiency factor YidD [bacterium]